MLTLDSMYARCVINMHAWDEPGSIFTFICFGSRKRKSKLGLHEQNVKNTMERAVAFP